MSQKPTATLTRATADPEHCARAAQLAEIGETLYRKGWMPGTSGSLSFCTSRDPIAMIVTVSGNDKGALTPADFLHVEGDFTAFDDPRRSSEALFLGAARPSGEVLVHKAIYDRLTADRARCVLHTHSIFNTLFSQLVPVEDGEIALPDVEMLKGLGRWEDGERVAIPLVPNHKHIPTLAEAVAEALDSDVPGVLVAGHGLYAFGPDIPRAKRHLESLEFLFELAVRKVGLGLK